MNMFRIDTKHKKHNTTAMSDGYMLYVTVIKQTNKQNSKQREGRKEVPSKPGFQLATWQLTLPLSIISLIFVKNKKPQHNTLALALPFSICPS